MYDEHEKSDAASEPEKIILPGPALPKVEVPGTLQSITQSARQLFTALAASHQFFWRGGLMQLVEEGDGYTLEALSPVAAQSRFEHFVRFTKTKNGLPWPVVITETIAKQYIHSSECRSLLPRIQSVINCPILKEIDGKLHRTSKGYDAATQLYCTHSQDVIPMPLADAVAKIQSLLDDFEFVSEGDRSRAIASFLTPALKLGGLIRANIPIDVGEADSSQSGKTYRQKLVAAIYNEQLGVVAKKTGGVGSLDESFSKHLLEGRTFIQFDNVRDKLDSQYLESFITANGPMEARIPYHAEVTVDSTKFIIFISSNGFKATKDLTNRSSIIRICKREGHNFQRFEGLDLLGYVQKHQITYLSAVFAVVEEWFAQGKLRTDETRHDAKEWAQVLDWIVQNIFKSAPLMDGHNEAKDVAANPQLSFVRSLAMEIAAKHEQGRDYSATELAEICINAGIKIAGLKDFQQTADLGAKQIGKIMGKVFEDQCQVNFGDFRLVKNMKTEKSAIGNSFQSKSYQFFTSAKLD